MGTLEMAEKTAKSDAVYYFNNHNLIECENEITKQLNTPSMGAAHLYAQTFAKTLRHLIDY